MKRFNNQWLEIITAAILFTLLTIPMYAPISLNMGTMIGDRWDGLLHTWILAWDVQKLGDGLRGLWDANIFWPHPDALAYSDHLLASSLLAAPLLWATGNPILAHNGLTFLSFILGGCGMFLLARRFTSHFTAALAAGIIFAYCPWRYGQIGHESQLLSSHWLPFALLFLHRCLDRKSQGPAVSAAQDAKPGRRDGRWLDGLLFGFFFALNALSSFYLAAMGALAAGTVFIVELVRSRGCLSGTVWTRLIAGGFLALLMIAPTIPPYYRVESTQGLARTIVEAENLSADPLDYFHAPSVNHLWGGITAPLANRYSPFPGEHCLFIGGTVLALAILGLLLRRRSGLHQSQKTYLWVAAVAFIFSLGPWLHLGWHRLPVPLPYLAAYYLPGFGGLRVPARFGFVVETALAILAAYGIHEIASRIKRRTVRTVFSLLALVALLIEFYPSTLPHHRLPTADELPPVYRWLAAQPDDVVVAELPQLPNLELLAEDSRRTGDPLGYRYLYYSIFHRKRLINGRSGFIPPTTDWITRKLLDFPSAESVRLLRYLGVNYLLLHTGAYQWDANLDADGLAAATEVFLPLTARFGPDRVYAIPDPLDARERRWWEQIHKREIYVPEAVEPGALFNLEICTTPRGDWPLCSFEKVSFNISAMISGSGKLQKYSTNLSRLITIDQGGEQWLPVTLRAPCVEGEYRWEVIVTSSDPAQALRWIIPFHQQVGPHPDSRAPDRLEASVVELSMPESVTAGQRFQIRGMVRNLGNTYWQAHQVGDVQKHNHGVVKPVIRQWRALDPPQRILDTDPYRCGGILRRSVRPGDQVIFFLDAPAPMKPGRYELLLQFVSEHVVWFAEERGGLLRLEIEVTSQ